MMENLSNKISLNSAFRYPFPEDRRNIWQVSPLLKIKNFLDRIFPVKQKKRAGNIEIWADSDKKTKTLGDGDFPLIVIVHNGRRFLPSFLKHYRQLGVTRFICVDDSSKDGSTEYLLDQPDVDVHYSNVRFREAARGKTWREMLAKKYGINRWYLNVDIDEYLFTGCNSTQSIAEYADSLFKQGIYRLPAPMIDMIPDGHLDEAVFQGENDKMPWEICSYFDREGYDGYSMRGGIKLFGGPRQRLWGATSELMKYPLLYWDEKTSLGVSIHSPRPLHRNTAPVCGALLHFKFFADIETFAKTATESGQYFNDGQEYKLMAKYFESGHDKVVRAEHSVRFERENDLVKLGFVVPVSHIS